MPVSAAIPGTKASARVPHSLARLAHVAALGLILLLLPLTLAATDSDKLTEAQRTEIIRTFLSEHPFAHRAIPRGKTGIHIEGAKITPSEAELDQLIAQGGDTAKGGEHVQITAIRFEHGGIYFEINGGPVKKKSWRERISVGVNNSEPQPLATHTIDESESNFNGSFVFLVIKNDASSFSTDHIKDLLSPVLDFHARTAAEAYEQSLPPLVAQAIKSHHALVGMDKDMVGHAMGRPPRRIRDFDDGQEYEEWIYGAPPEDVEFIRFVGDKVVRIEDMTVSGDKRVRSENEIAPQDCGTGSSPGGLTAGARCATLDASTSTHPRPDSMAAPSEKPRTPPTLRRPGESSPTPSDASRDRNPAPPPDLPAPSPNTPR